MNGLTTIAGIQRCGPVNLRRVETQSNVPEPKTQWAGGGYPVAPVRVGTTDNAESELAVQAMLRRGKVLLQGMAATPQEARDLVHAMNRAAAGQQILDASIMASKPASLFVGGTATPITAADMRSYTKDVVEKVYAKVHAQERGHMTAVQQAKAKVLVEVARHGVASTYDHQGHKIYVGGSVIRSSVPQGHADSPMTWNEFNAATPEQLDHIAAQLHVTRCVHSGLMHSGTAAYVARLREDRAQTERADTMAAVRVATSLQAVDQQRAAWVKSETYDPEAELTALRAGQCKTVREQWLEAKKYDSEKLTPEQFNHEYHVDFSNPPDPAAFEAKVKAERLYWKGK